MLQAYLILPALGILYLAGTRTRGWKLVGHGALAAFVLLIVSLSWVTVVDLIPSDERPYIGSSDTNSALELALGYNGLQRLLGINPFSNSDGGQAPAGGGGGVGGVNENGPEGFLRLIDHQLGGQASWLLPLALIGIVAGSMQTRFRRRLPLSPEQQSVAFWGVWLITCAVFFSIASFYHRYYLVTIAPAIAALAGIGVVALWREYQRRGWRRFDAAVGAGRHRRIAALPATRLQHLVRPLDAGNRWRNAHRSCRAARRLAHPALRAATRRSSGNGRGARCITGHPGDLGRLFDVRHTQRSTTGRRT